MIKVICRTNLDLHKAEKFPTQLPARPIPGDYIYSKHVWPNNHRLRLMVVSVTLHEDHLEVELHLPNTFENIRSFYKDYYEPLTNWKYI